MSRLPIVAVVGRPNVGKSTFVNRVLKRRAAVVQERPGVTRDRREFVAEWNGREFLLVDTGGWEVGGDELTEGIRGQAEAALGGADFVVFVADGTDGLARDQEAPQLRALGRSIGEPAIRDLYRAYVSAFVRRYHPDYVGLAAETNLTRTVGSPALYQALVAAANAAASDLLADPAHPPLFVSVQVEVAWGKLVGSGGFVGVEQDLIDFPFVQMLGLSSYPYFAWPAPADLPDDYYARLVAGRSLPVMVVEGGWASSLTGTGFTTATQAAYLRRQAELLSRVNGLGLIQLTFTDLDLTTYPADVQAPLEPFAHLGLVDAQFRPKPALEVWDSLFALPLSR